MKNGVIRLQADEAKKAANALWLQANDVSHPKEKKALVQKANMHYTKARKLAKQVSR